MIVAGENVKIWAGEACRMLDDILKRAEAFFGDLSRVWSFSSKKPHISKNKARKLAYKYAINNRHLKIFSASSKHSPVDRGRHLARLRLAYHHQVGWVCPTKAFCVKRCLRCKHKVECRFIRVVLPAQGTFRCKKGFECKGDCGEIKMI